MPVFFEKKVKVLVTQLSDYSQSHGLYPTRLFCPWNSAGRNTGSGLSLPSSGDITERGIEPRYPALQGDSLPTEPPGGLVLKPFIFYCKFFSIIISFADTSFYNENLVFHYFLTFFSLFFTEIQLK